MFVLQTNYLSVSSGYIAPSPADLHTTREFEDHVNFHHKTELSMGNTARQNV